MSIYNVVNFLIFFIQASEDDKGKTLVKYHAKNKSFLFLPTPSRGTGETRQETAMLTEYKWKYLLEIVIKLEWC